MNGGRTERIRILHVEDDPEFAELTAEFLEDTDDSFDIETVGRASAGLERLAEGGIDCVVSDYDMPGMNGNEFLAAVREEYPELPFILFTGKGDESVASEAISAGVTDYLQKEAGRKQYELLANRIRNAVDGARTERQRRRQITAIETAREGISILDDEGRFIYVNQAYADLYGYDSGEMVGEHWSLIYPDNAVERIEEGILPTVEEEGYWRGETVGLRADGSTFTEDHSLATTADGGLVCTIRETEGTSDPVAGLDGEAFLEQALDSLEDLFYVIDRDGELLWVNERACEVTGYTEAELLSMEPAELVAPDDRTRVATDIQEALETGRTTDELTLLTKEGEPVPVEFRKRRLTDSEGAPTGVVGIGRDVSERREREHKLQALFDNAPVAIAYTEFSDGSPIVRDVNDAFTETFGYEPEAAVGRDLDELLVPAERSAEATAVNRRVQEGEQFEVEVRRQTPDGLRDFLLHSIPLRLDEAGKQGYAMYNDITERKEYRRELERQNERLDEFAGIVSHDLRNPLKVAQGRLELARQDCECEHHADIAAAHDRMATLIDDLLTLARQGADVDEVTAVDLRAVVEGCWATVGTDDIELHLETDRAIEADRGRLKQLLENLFRNALEHAGEGARVTVGDLDGGGFYVADDGPGIPEEMRERVFEPGTAGPSGGDGFGLSIIRRIVEAHGWTVTVTESEAGGARFEFSDVEPA